jgi:hypothetical protein
MATTKKIFSQTDISDVWKKARVIDDVDAGTMRQDYAGAWIRFADYGNRNSQYGWEIDHLKPVSLNGADNISNYLPLQWQNNVKKGDDYPRWTTAVTSDGQNNIEREKYWKVNV